jgi:hypothetical protein
VKTTFPAVSRDWFGFEGWFGIECPLISFSSLDHEDSKKLHPTAFFATFFAPKLLVP